MKRFVSLLLAVLMAAAVLSGCAAIRGSLGTLARDGPELHSFSGRRPLWPGFT